MRLAPLSLLAALLSACSGSEGTTSNSDTGSITITVQDSAGAAVNGASLTLNGKMGTTQAGAYTFPVVPAGELLVVSANKAGGVTTYARVSADAGKTADVLIVLPAVTTASYTPDGKAHTFTLGALSVSIPGDVTWTDKTSKAYAGAVELRAATSPGPFSAPPSYPIDASGMQTSAAPVVATFDLTAFGAGEAVLEPSGPITAALTAPVFDPAGALHVEHFDPAAGDWVKDGSAARDAMSGLITATLPHFTYWHIRNGTPTYYGGFSIVASQNGVAIPNTKIDWKCSGYDLNDNANPMGSVIAPDGTLCVQVSSGSACTVTVDDTLKQLFTVTNGCVCNSANEPCPVVEFEPSSPPVCGDLVIEAGEQCDDGNIIPGDGCDAVCHREGCDIQWHGAIDGVVADLSAHNLLCDFQVDMNGDAQALIVHDGSLDPFVMAGGISKWQGWQGYADAMGKVLGVFNFKAPYHLVPGNPQPTDAAMLGGDDIGNVIQFDYASSTFEIDAIDTTGETLNMNLTLPLKAAAGGYPGAPNPNPMSTDLDLQPTMQGDTSTMTITGHYGAISSL